MKICRKCQKRQPLENYHLNNTSKDGRKWICKDCYNKKYEGRSGRKTKGEFLVDDIARTAFVWP